MRAKFRRLERLEKLAPAYIEKMKKKEEARLAQNRRAASYHAIRLGALVLREDPKLDEPLEAAWARCLARFHVLSDIEVLSPADGYEFGDALCLQKPVLENLPGDTEQHKFQHLFDTAPHWLLVFTRAFTTASILDLKIPDLSDTPRPGYIGCREGRKWPGLPNGTLQAGKPIGDVALKPDEAMQLMTLLQKPDQEWNRHDRRQWRELIGRIDSEELERALLEWQRLGEQV